MSVSAKVLDGALAAHNLQDILMDDCECGKC